MDTKKRSLGIHFLGWGIVLGNSLLILFHYWPETRDPAYAPNKFVSLLAMAAAFPLDFYHSYLREALVAQFAWITVMIFCGLGILLLNRFARNVFIVLNIMHITILAYFVVSRFGREYEIFLDHFFKLYFNLVAAGTYVTFLTFPEVREQFRLDIEEMKVKLWFLRSSLPPVVPKNPNSYYNLGLAYSRLNRYDDAIAALEKAVAINPENEKFHFYLGLARVRQKYYSAAIASFKEAVRQNPLNEKAYYQLGLIYQIQGCDREAVTCFEQANHIREDNAEVLAKLGEVYASVGRIPEAIKALSQAANINPGDENLYYQLGKIYLTQPGQEGQSQESFKKAVQLNPRRTDSHFQLGKLAIKASRNKDAVRHFKDAIRWDEDHLQAHYQLGFVYVLLQDFDSARREQRYLRDRDPDLAQQLSLLLK